MTEQNINKWCNAGFRYLTLISRKSAEYENHYPPISYWQYDGHWPHLHCRSSNLHKRVSHPLWYFVYFSSQQRVAIPILAKDIHINEVSIIVPVQEQETEKKFIILQKIWTGYHATWKRRRAEWRGCKPDSWPCFELPGELLRFPPKRRTFYTI